MTQLDPLVFGHRLRHFRRRNGMTLDELGAAIGRPGPFLSLVENGKREPRLSELGALAEAVGVGVSDLLDSDPPDRRADLEIRLARAQAHPRYEELELPRLKPSARLPDEAIEHIVTLFEEMAANADTGLTDAAHLSAANGELTRWLRDQDGYLEHIEAAARGVLRLCDYEGRGPLTTRHINEIADGLGYAIRTVDDVPAAVRSIVDHVNRRIYVAQRNELRTRQARKAVVQTLGSIVLAQRTPRSPFEMLRRRLESAYFAAAVLVPESSAVPYLRSGRDERDLSVEDLKEKFYVSYEMAAQRLCNLATRHLSLPTHFIRSDEEGRVHKAYANDGVPLPVDGFGGSEGRRLCREWGARAAFGSAEKFDIHYQFTNTGAGSYWCATHIASDLSGHAFTVGVRFEDARVFRGRNTVHQRQSRCPDGICCRRPDTGLARTWTGRIEAHLRSQAQIVHILSSLSSPGPDAGELFQFGEDHAGDKSTENPSHLAPGE